MGYVLAMSECFCCKQVFGYNPNKVPSIRVQGVRQPICKSCIEQANPLRKQHGLPELIPLPGAYEAEDEDAIRWSS